jgi:hypothetical protein
VLPQNLREKLQLAEGQSLFIQASRGHADVMTEDVYKEVDSATAPLATDAWRAMKRKGLK